MAEPTRVVERRKIGTVPPFLHAAFRNVRGGGGGASDEAPVAAPQDEGAGLKLRDDGDDRRLAAQVVNCQVEDPAGKQRQQEEARNRSADEPCSQRRMRPNRWASSSRWRTEEGGHFLPPRTRLPI